MLLIGDIHITTRVKDALLDQLRAFVAKHPDEQHIVFVGDYVYHFAYDRAASLALYSFFIELFEQGKTIYVLAGNHDWLTDSFVYAEAKKAFDLLHGAHNNKLYFITEPMQCLIEWQNVLFLPYMLNPEALQSIAQSDVWVAWQHDVRVLTESSHKHEKMSGLLTNYILQTWEKSPDLLVIFHQYIAHTRLPGQQSMFGYKDVALHPGLLDLSWLRLLSGHVHQVCSYKNYIGIGSIRHTSPLEVQEIKWLFLLVDGVMTMEPVLLYPYLQVQELDGLDRKAIQSLLVTIWQTVQSYFVSESWSMKFETLPIVDMKQLSITILRDDVSYDQLSSVLSSDILEWVRDIKIKKDAVAMQDLLSDFSAQQHDLQSGFADWKEILKAYIQKKYPTQIDMYMTVLQDMGLV